MEVPTPNTPESPASSVVPLVESMTLDVPKLVSHEHRLEILSELTGYPLPKQHRGRYYLLTDLFSLHAFLKRRNALKRIHSLPIQGKWIKLHSGGRYCTLASFDKHVLKYIQTEYSRKILDHLTAYPNDVETEDEEDEDDNIDAEEDTYGSRNFQDEVRNVGGVVKVRRVNGDSDTMREEDMLDELEHDATEPGMDVESKPLSKVQRFQRTFSVKYGSSMPFKPKEGTNGTTRAGRSRSSKSYSSTPSSVSFTSDQNFYSQSRARTSTKRPNEQPIQPESALRQQQKVRAIQIQEDMIKEERSCVQLLYSTLRQLHQQIATEYKEETAKQISVITEQLKHAKTRLKEVLEFDI